MNQPTRLFTNRQIPEMTPRAWAKAKSMKLAS